MAEMPEIKVVLTVDHKDEEWLRTLIGSIVEQELNKRSTTVELNVTGSRTDDHILELVKQTVGAAFVHFEREWRHGFDPHNSRKG